MLGPKPHWREDEKADSATKLTPDKFRIPFTDAKSTNSFMQNGNNARVVTSTINPSRSIPLWEKRDQLSENQEENKSLYPDCVLVIQYSHSHLYSKKNNNLSV